MIDPFTIKPLDSKTIIEHTRQTRGRILTVEDHYYEGMLFPTRVPTSRIWYFWLEHQAVREVDRHRGVRQENDKDGAQTHCQRYAWSGVRSLSATPESGTQE